MEIKSDDIVLISNVVENISAISKNESNKISENYPKSKNQINSLNFVYPFDEEIINGLNSIRTLSSSTNLYSIVPDLKNLWFQLIDKSIKCLRYFDSREPYLEFKDKAPQSYGIERLAEYYDEFSEFEALLYGSNQFYRDHVIHLFRTWLIGLNILISDESGVLFYEIVKFEGVDIKEFKPNFFECISMWTLASLCHDLGYPLEKFQNVLSKTQKMMEYLVSQPKIHQDIAFSGTQDKINDYIIRMMSGKMNHKQIEKDITIYNARVQSKYYIKYSKSLENYSHGIVSSIIIYKALLYFLESDFSFHDDHKFDYNDAKQFYIRRDILRSISSHTCWDIYHLRSNTFPLLLIIADELQEWGRKKWIDLYRNETMPDPHFKLATYDKKYIIIEYEFKKTRRQKVERLIASFYNQFQKFRMLLRDGEDTSTRVFTLHIRYNIEIYRTPDKTLNISSSIPAKEAATFEITGKGFAKKLDFKKLIGEFHDPKEIIEDKDFYLKLS